MPFGAAAALAVGGAAASVGSSLIAGNQQANAVKGAASQARQDLQPFTTAGTNALGVVGDISGANGPDAATAAMGNFFTSPGYQFRLDEGLRNINQGAAAQGAFRSGATVKAEDAYSQGLASDEFSNYYNRLFNLSQMGEKAASGQADVAQAQGKQLASIFGNEGQAIGSTISGLTGNQAVVGGFNSLFGSGGGGGVDSGTWNV